jgi:Spy/CpxP family protein refolding chaperone
MRTTMKLSRSVLLTSCLAAAAFVGCGGTADVSSGRASPTATPVVEAAAAPAAKLVTASPDAPAEATPPPSEEAAPGRRHGPFAVLETLDLRPEQRAKVDAIHTTLQTSLDATHREGRELALLFASSLEGGRLDEAAVKEKRVAFETKIVDARSAFADAANAVHATLDPAQRSELVFTLRAKREGRRTERELAHDAATGREHHERGVSRLASELGLSAEQTRSIREGARSIVEAALPDRKARREQMEAEVKAAEEAFLTDSFDAHTYSFGKDATAWLETAAKGATALTDLATAVLTQGQRAALAAKIREGSQAR